jgi:hypothetical protein
MISLSSSSLLSRVCLLPTSSQCSAELPSGWKRVLLADGPRQTINALTLYALYLVHKGDGHWYDIGKYFENNSLSTSALTVSTTFSVVVFAGSLLQLIVAGICYIPLLAHIRGNLKVSITLRAVSVFAYITL